MIAVAVCRAPAGTCPASRAPIGARCSEPAAKAAWGLLLVFIVIGGIYLGVFTPTEAAAVSAVYALVIAVFVYRDFASTRHPARARREREGDSDADVHHRQRDVVRVRAHDGANTAGGVRVDLGARPAGVGFLVDL